VKRREGEGHQGPVTLAAEHDCDLVLQPSAVRHVLIAGGAICTEHLRWAAKSAQYLGMNIMSPFKIFGVILIVAGVLGLAYGGFSYTKDTTAAKIGPLEISVKEKEAVNVPVWAGVGAIVAGGLLLVFSGRKA